MELGRLTVEALLGAVGVIITATVFTVGFSNLRLSAHRDHHRDEDQRLQDELDKGAGGWGAFRLISANFQAAALDPIAVATIRVTNAMTAALVFVVVAYIATRGGQGWSVAEASAVAVGPIVQAAVAGLGIQETRALRRSIVNTLNDRLVDVLSYRHPLIEDDRSWFALTPTASERAVIDQTVAAAARLKERRRFPMVRLFEAVAATAAGDWPRARSLVDAAVHESGDDAVALSTAAAVYLHAAQAQMPDEDPVALAEHTVALAQRVDDAGLRFDLAALTRVRARAHDLLANLDPTPDRVRQAIVAYESAINCDPANLRLRLDRAYFVQPFHDALVPPFDPTPIELVWVDKMRTDLDLILEADEDLSAVELRGVTWACLRQWDLAAADFERVAARSGWGTGTYHVASLVLGGHYMEALASQHDLVHPVEGHYMEALDGVNKIMLRGEGPAGAEVLEEAAFWHAVAESQLDGGTPGVVADALEYAGWTQDRADTLALLQGVGLMRATDTLAAALDLVGPPGPAAPRRTIGGLVRLTADGLPAEDAAAEAGDLTGSTMPR